MNELDPEYNALIESNRVSAKTRATLRGRLDSAGEPAAKNGLAREAVRTLQTIAECVAPLTGRSIDFGAHINARLATGEGKGCDTLSFHPILQLIAQGSRRSTDSV
jgi:hypothetical protein